MTDTTTSIEWAEILSICALDYRKDGEMTYNYLIELIKSACNGAFTIYSGPRPDFKVAVKQIKPLPWKELFLYIKISKKIFYILLPDILRTSGVSIDKCHRVKGFKFKIPERMYAQFDEVTDTVKLWAYTGNVEEEENIYPAYDGYGRYDYYYESIEGRVDVNANWVIPPSTQWI